jgi:hypothetical protein
MKEILLEKPIYFKENGLKIPDFNYNSNLQEFTFSFWIFLTKNQETCFFKKKNVFSISMTTFGRISINSLNETLSSNTKLQLSQWHFISFVKKKNLFELYLNRKLESSVKSTNLQWNFFPFEFLTFHGMLSNVYLFHGEEEEEEEILSPPTNISSMLEPILLEFLPMKSLSELDEWEPTWNERRSTIQRREKKERKYKFLHCHDMNGGYLEDRFTQGCKDTFHVYNFYEWKNIDIFIYFSHHRITIPRRISFKFNFSS